VWGYKRNHVRTAAESHDQREMRSLFALRFHHVKTIYSFLRLFFSGRFRTPQPLRRSAAALRLIMRDIEKFTLIDL
jgi:hypothetical protein